MIEYIKTGIPGLDEAFNGKGILKRSAILVTGAPGTGKSIIALQYLIEGAKQGIPCLYITSEEPAPILRQYAKNIGLDIEEYEKKGLLMIYEQPITGKIISIEAPLHLIREKKIQRVVMDSLTLFEYAYSKDEDRFEFRRGILTFIEDMRKEGATLIATSENFNSDIDAFRFKDQDFLFEGVIILSRIRKGASFERTLFVAKMRGQEHLLDIFPLKIGKGGAVVQTKQIPFSLLEKESHF